MARLRVELLFVTALACAAIGRATDSCGPGTLFPYPVQGQPDPSYDASKVDWALYIEAFKTLHATEARICGFAIRMAFHDKAATNDAQPHGSDASLLLNQHEVILPHNTQHGEGPMMRYVMAQLTTYFGCSWIDGLMVAAAVCTEFMGSSVNIANACDQRRLPFYVNKIDRHVDSQAHANEVGDKLPGGFSGYLEWVTFFTNNLRRVMRNTPSMDWDANGWPATDKYSVPSARWEMSVADGAALMGSHTLMDPQACTTDCQGNQRNFYWDNAYFKDMLSGTAQLRWPSQESASEHAEPEEEILRPKFYGKQGGPVLGYFGRGLKSVNASQPSGERLGQASEIGRQGRTLSQITSGPHTKCAGRYQDAPHLISTRSCKGFSDQCISPAPQLCEFQTKAFEEKTTRMLVEVFHRQVADGLMTAPELKEAKDAGSVANLVGQGHHGHKASKFCFWKPNKATRAKCCSQTGWECNTCGEVDWKSPWCYERPAEEAPWFYTANDCHLHVGIRTRDVSKYCKETGDELCADLPAGSASVQSQGAAQVHLQTLRGAFARFAKDNTAWLHSYAHAFCKLNMVGARFGSKGPMKLSRLLKMKRPAPRRPALNELEKILKNILTHNCPSPEEPTMFCQADGTTTDPQ